MDSDFWELENLLSEIDEFLNKYEENKEEIQEIILSFIERIEKTNKELMNISKKLEYITLKLKNLVNNSQSPSKYEEKGNRIKGEITPKAFFRLHILLTLYELGGKAPALEVHKKLEKKLNDLLTQKDKELLPSGTVRWIKNVDWCRLILVHEGLMKRDSPRGIWELSEKGYKYIKKYLEEINGRE